MSLICHEARRHSWRIRQPAELSKIHQINIEGLRLSVVPDDFCIKVEFSYLCNMKQEITIRDISDLERAAQEFLDKIGERTLVAFFAPMGSGKTTFTTALCKVLGVTDPVGSPTFAIVNEYMRADGEPMYHFDFYRINKLEEAIEIGLYDYLDSGCLCIMEWPENIEELLPEDTLCIHITVNPDQSRTLSWED